MTEALMNTQETHVNHDTRKKNCFTYRIISIGRSNPNAETGFDNSNQSTYDVSKLASKFEQLHFTNSFSSKNIHVWSQLFDDFLLNLHS